jgi:hypothetical protein
MRQAINENRTVQLVLLAVLAIAGGLMIMKVMGGGGNEATVTQTPLPSAGSSATAPTSAVSTGLPTAGTPVSASAAVPASLIPGPGLPKGLLSSYHHGDAIALLVRRAGGVDDGLVHSSVDRLSSFSDVKVYVTMAKHIARYAWLTQGVNVTDLPALVVLRPRKLSNGKATASVSYGFRDSASVAQAVKDALYRGPTDRPYHP